MAGKGLFRRMLGLCGILLAGIAVGFALLTAVFLLPVDAMEEHVLASIPALSGEWGTGRSPTSRCSRATPPPSWIIPPMLICC